MSNHIKDANSGGTTAMKAVLFTGAETPSEQLVERPPRAADRVLLRVVRVGICGTDLSILSGKHPRARAPLVLGHEIAAYVDHIGAAAAAERSDLSVGDLVTVEPIISCGTCGPCRRGLPHVCRNLRLYGIDLPGGMAEFMSVAAHRIVRAPHGMSPDLVVLAEPLAVAVHTVRLSGIRYGDSVCVIGGGPIGLLTALVAQAATPVPVLVSEPVPSRREVAGELGLEVIDPVTQPLDEFVNERTGGEGVDRCFETAGSQPAINAATRVLRSRGTLIQVSMPKEPRYVNLVDITFKELVVKGVRVYEPFDFEHALDFLARKPELFRPLLSRPYQLDEAVEAFSAARAGDQGLRIVFHAGA
ncbi:MAG: Zn-dependent alcohol dehydrogenase [Spirochaetaceae bacterium]|nr:MAG: Zn-dependent alcohol dehydrogenase [Spirochaetaceae bacterium]